ncbi:fumarylacetoacetate hydrolase family protein [Acuticoccus mangrovi]|uniref:Fumarylacetoacetate hydrolase family protein n=1 Tax=Acuticoccus mangrovi TaxID=2796142 RepID=A0A934IM51_9HYPH|nr:fumarylacetoacetate hydrolase family protein [Acuticoccus mangrovi]MBJ3774951.1 fumarylacetoacetate hydrolase family protein [Acuticoccus mangrovi]
MSLLFQSAPVSLPITGAGDRFAVRRIYCVGRNYVTHIREMKEGDERDPPFFFQKPTDAVVESGSAVPYPPATSDLQFEVELVVAIGEGGRDIAVADALGHVFGYAVGIDLTRRDLQVEARAMQRPWEPGKAFDHSAPCGPIVPAAVIPAPLAATIVLEVNEETRQVASTAEMIWNVPEIIANLSAAYALSPGDLIFTGTPAGVGPVVPGDTIAARIDGLAPLTITIVEGT